MTNPSFSLLIEIIFMKRWPQLWRFCLLHKTGSEDSRCHRICSRIQRVGIVVQLLYYNTHPLIGTTILNSDANRELKRKSTLSLTRWPAEAMQSKAHHNTMKWNTAIDRYSTGRTDTTTHIQQVCCPNKLHGKYLSDASSVSVDCKVNSFKKFRGKTQLKVFFFLKKKLDFQERNRRRTVGTFVLLCHWTVYFISWYDGLNHLSWCIAAEEALVLSHCSHSSWQRKALLWLFYSVTVQWCG